MRLSLFLAPVALGLTVAGCHRGGSAAPTPAAPTTPTEVTAASIALGDSIYHSGGCQRCHGQKGIGANNGPSLVAGPWLHSSGKYEEIAATITNGIQAAAIKDSTRRFPMRPRGGPMNLSDDQVKALAAYVWSISRDKK